VSFEARGQNLPPKQSAAHGEVQSNILGRQ
jgi:hypothetical protein